MTKSRVVTLKKNTGIRVLFRTRVLSKRELQRRNLSLKKSFIIQRARNVRKVEFRPLRSIKKPSNSLVYLLNRRVSAGPFHYKIYKMVSGVYSAVNKRMGQEGTISDGSFPDSGFHKFAS